MFNAGIIIQARINSIRLHSKIMKKIIDKPMIYYLIERLNKTNLDIIIATSVNKENNILIEYINNNFPKIKIIRGSENNVLSRFIDAIKKFSIDYCIRITSDNPCIYYENINKYTNYVIKNKIDYANIIGTPTGLGYEIFNSQKLLDNFDKMTKKYHKEHVTPYFYENPDKFKLYSFNEKLDLKARLTVDTSQDFELIKSIYNKLYKNNPIPTLEIINFIKQNKNLLDINKNIIQKKYNE